MLTKINNTHWRTCVSAYSTAKSSSKNAVLFAELPEKQR